MNNTEVTFSFHHALPVQRRLWCAAAVAVSESSQSSLFPEIRLHCLDSQPTDLRRKDNHQWPSGLFNKGRKHRVMLFFLLVFEIYLDANENQFSILVVFLDSIVQTNLFGLLVYFR